MKNVNATMLMCASTDLDNPGNVSFNGVFDSIIPTKEDNLYHMTNMNIILCSTIVFDDCFKDQDDCLKLNIPYEFMVRLTHVQSGFGVPLNTFDLTVEQKDLKTWCKSFFEYKRVIRIKNLTLPKGLGDYALKLLIRPKADDSNATWNTQTIHTLTVGESR